MSHNALLLHTGAAIWYLVTTWHSLRKGMLGRKWACPVFCSITPMGTTPSVTHEMEESSFPPSTMDQGTQRPWQSSLPACPYEGVFSGACRPVMWMLSSGTRPCKTPHKPDTASPLQECKHVEVPCDSSDLYRVGCAHSCSNMQLLLCWDSAQVFPSRKSLNCPIARQGVLFLLCSQSSSNCWAVVAERAHHGNPIPLMGQPLRSRSFILVAQCQTPNKDSVRIKSVLIARKD